MIRVPSASVILIETFGFDEVTPPVKLTAVTLLTFSVIVVLPLEPAVPCVKFTLFPLLPSFTAVISRADTPFPDCAKLVLLEPDVGNLYMT